MIYKYPNLNRNIPDFEVPKKKGEAIVDWDVIEFPSPHKVYIDSSGWALSKNSKNKKEAVELIKYLSGTEASREFAKSGLIVPANNEITLVSKEKPKNYKAFTDMIKNAKPTPVNENYAAINDIINEKVENIFNNKQKAEDVFDDKTIKTLEGLL